MENVNPVLLQIMKDWRSHVHVSRDKKTRKTTFKKVDQGLTDKKAAPARGDNVAAAHEEKPR